MAIFVGSALRRGERQADKQLDKTAVNTVQFQCAKTPKKKGEKKEIDMNNGSFRRILSNNLALKYYEKIIQNYKIIFL